MLSILFKSFGAQNAVLSAFNKRHVNYNLPCYLIKDQILSKNNVLFDSLYLIHNVILFIIIFMDNVFIML